MAEKFAIYFGEPLATATAGYEDQRSARVNLIAHEWLHIISDNVPNLSVPEWQAVMAATTSTALGDDAALKLLWATVADAGPECRPHGVDCDALAAKLRGLTVSQRYALRETLERAWHACDAGDDVSSALRSAGALRS
jgi:dihydroxyacetone kinase